jgi:predicted SAM-dependent methyltransferase
MLRKLINFFLRKSGYEVLSRKRIRYYSAEELKSKYDLSNGMAEYLKAKTNEGLKEKLIREQKTRWLDVGCGGTFEDNFFYIDVFSEALARMPERYFRLDIINAPKEALRKLGKFDLIRMQHVFEHFTPEDGVKVLNNLAELLNTDGYILISTPDLKRYIQLYLSGKIRENFDWALKRIDSDSPNSFYFSIFSHSMLFEKHEWCYDAEGLIYQLERTAKFKEIQEIKLTDALANVPFTHKRPNEDVCIIAKLK